MNTLTPLESLYAWSAAAESRDMPLPPDLLGHSLWPSSLPVYTPSALHHWQLCYHAGWSRGVG